MEELESGSESVTGAVLGAWAMIIFAEVPPKAAGTLDHLGFSFPDDTASEGSLVLEI